MDTTRAAGTKGPSLPASGKWRLIIVDDHPIVREGFRGLLSGTEFDVVAEADSVADAKRLLREHTPNVLVVDLSLRQGDGLELVRDARARDTHLRILVVSMQDERVYAQRLMSAGADGYLMKQSAAKEFVSALRRIMSGHVYVSEELGAELIGRIAGGAPSTPATPLDDLSDRELQVLSLIGRGKSTSQIAAELHLSSKTIESHRMRIKQKLGLQTSAQLVHFAIQSTQGK